MQFALQAAALRDVAEDENDADELIVFIPDRRGGVVDGPPGAVAGNEDGMIGQAGDAPRGDHLRHGTFGGLTGFLVDDVEQRQQRLADAFFLAPAD